MTAPDDHYRNVTLATAAATVFGRLYDVPGGRAGVVCVGGIGGDWDTPAAELYPRLGRGLRAAEIATLRVRYRRPSDLAACTDDVLAGIDHLVAHGSRAVGLVGHSFGGAVVIQAAARRPVVRAVVTLATQARGTDAVEGLGPGCALLVVHGLDDEILPARCSQDVYRRAGEPKRLVLLAGAGHGLDAAAARVLHEVSEWLETHLRADR